MNLQYDIVASLSTDNGCVRQNNEDCLQFLTKDTDPLNVLAIIADGMGGHVAGEKASYEAVQRIQSYYFAKHYFKSSISILKEALKQANASIYQLAKHDSTLLGMGTTATVLAIVKGYAYYAHVGDTRLYLLRDDQMLQLTQDHTLVGQLLEDGLITPEQAHTHPDRHVITRALGTQPSVIVDVINKPLPIRIGDVFMLCSDGLYDLVDDIIIARIISSFAPNEASHRLIELARSAGGFDNISVIILAVQAINSMLVNAPITRS